MCVCVHMCVVPASLHLLPACWGEPSQVWEGHAAAGHWGQAAEPCSSREEEEEDENSRGSMLLWPVVKFCCGQICCGMRLSSFPLTSPVFPGTHMGISVPQMCRNQQFSSRHGRLSSAVPLGQ